MSSVLTRWQAKRPGRERLLADARTAFHAHPTKLAAAKVRLRKAQLAQCERVIARYAPITTVSDKLVKFVKQREGGMSRDGLFHVYWDKNGNCWTQGYGHTENVKAGDKPWTEKHATSVLRADLNGTYAQAALDCIKLFHLTKIRQWEFDALVTVAYNLGRGAINHATGFETLSRALSTGDRKQVAKALLIYDHDANGQRLTGLTYRRQDEGTILVRGVYPPPR
jgi:lysozyme